MKTRLLPFLIPVVAMLVFTLSLRNTRAAPAEIGPVTNLLPDITVSLTNNANEDLDFTDDETTTPTSPLSAVYELVITNNGLEELTITGIDVPGHDLAGSECASYINGPLPAQNSITCTFTGTFTDDNVTEIISTATVAVVDGSSNPGTGSDTTTVRVIDIQPDITVSLTNDADDNGDFNDDETTALATPLSALYQLTITNNTAEDLTLTAIDDPDQNLAGSDCASYINGSLLAEDSITCTYTATFTDDNVTAIISTATVTVADDDTNSDTGSDTTTVNTIDIQPEITVVKTNDADGDGTFNNQETATLGATVTFRVAITNETAEAVTIDSIDDSIYGADSELTSAETPQCADVIGDSVAGSGSILCYFDGIVDDDDLTEINTVTVTVIDDDSNDDVKSDDSTVNVADIIPAITVVKDNDADGNGAYNNVEQVPVGQNSVTFRLTIANDTPEAVTIDSIVDSEHGANATLTTTAPGLASCAALVGQSLAGDQTKICYFDGTVATNVPSETNTITVSFSDDDSNSDSAGDTSTVLVPRLAVSKTPDTQTVLIGNDATFTISVTNNGGVALSNVTVTDAQAPGCNRTFSTLAAGANQTYTCTRTAVTADFTNVVNVSGQDTLGGTVAATDTAAVNVINPKIDIAKDPDVQEIPRGGSAQFTITVENIGDVTLTNVSVTDPQAPGCNRNIGTLAAGADNTYTCSLNNVVEDFLNEATVSGRHPLNDTVEAQDTAFVDVNEPGIAIFKNPAVQTIPKGGTATFNIAVVNTGLVDLVDVQVIDLFTPNCNRSIGDLDAGDDFTYTCQAANVEDRLVNVATVTGTNPASGNAISDSGVAIVEILDAAVTVQATPASLPAPGGSIKFTVTVINEGSQDMALTRLNSNRYGVLSSPSNGNVQNNNCDFTTPPTIDANGGAYNCTFRAEEKPRQPGNYHLAVTAVFDNGATTATGNTTVTITEPPTVHLYLPVALNNFAVGEPNDAPCQAYPLSANQIFHFLADDSSDWYRFVLSGSANVVVELTNFVPQSGQLLVYRDTSGCGSLTNSDLIGQNGNFSTTKIVNLGQRPSGQYYIRIINDGVLNSNDPYQLQVIVDDQN